MDDSWQKALFTQNAPDLPRNVLIQMMENIAGCSNGRLRELEAGFYGIVGKVYDSYDLLQVAV